MFKLALNAGHGINTAGKRCLKSLDPNETREWFLNNRICCKIQENLSKYNGIEIKRMDDTTGQIDKTIATRTKNANSFGADLYLSIHHNAGINGGSGGGIMAFTYLSVDKTTIDWQKYFYDAAIAHTGLKGNRASPIARADFGECRLTSMPAVLMECGFMDSTTDTPIILTEEFAEKIALAFSDTIIKRCGLKLKEVQQTFIKNNYENLYRVRESWEKADSQIGAYKELQNAIKIAEKSSLNVYDNTGNCVWKYGETNNSQSSEQQSNIIINLLKKILSLLTN